MTKPAQEYSLKNIVDSSLNIQDTEQQQNLKTLADFYLRDQALNNIFFIKKVLAHNPEYAAVFNQTYKISLDLTKYYNSSVDLNSGNIPNIDEMVKADLLTENNSSYNFDINTSKQLEVDLIKSLKTLKDLLVLKAKLKNEKYLKYFLTQLLYTSSFFQVAAQLILQIDVVKENPSVTSETFLAPFFKEFTTIGKNDDLHTILMKNYYFLRINVGEFLELKEFKDNYPFLYKEPSDTEQETRYKDILFTQFDALFDNYIKRNFISYIQSKSTEFQKFNETPFENNN